MKKLLISIGIFLAPMAAHAEALSPWVQGVLDKTQDGIDFAATLSTTSCHPETLLSEADNNQSLLRALVLPADAREKEAESLRESTVCYQSDRHRLELKIREVQDAMADAIQHCQVDRNKALREVYAFSVGAYVSFLRGGTDPNYKDDRLRYRYPFEDATRWSEGAGAPVIDTGSVLPLCPYTTDYGVHAIGYIPTPVGGGALSGDESFDLRSFGCDEEVLGTIEAPYDQEASRLRDFMSRTRDVSSSIYDTVSTALFTIDNLIAILTGTIPVTEMPGSKPPPPHAEQTGCLRPLQPDFDADTPAEINAVLNQYPDYFESHNLRDDGSGNSTYNPSPDETLPVGTLHLPIIDYFLSVPNGGILTRRYIDAREEAGKARRLPEYLVSEQFDSMYNAFERTVITSGGLQEIQANIEREMGIFESGNTDALERMQDSSVPLEAAVQSLIQVVNEDLPEKYIPQVAFFLARSCVDGHCQQTLDAVLKRTFNPYCHPYVEGLYREEDAHKRCFCYPEIESKAPDFWKKYCSNSLTSEDMDKYNNIEAEPVPACIEEHLRSSSSSESSWDADSLSKQLGGVTVLA